MATTSAAVYLERFAGGAPPVDRATELELFRRFRLFGDARAGERLVRAHLRSVIVLAYKYRHYGVPVAELIAEGNFGLVHALGKFDPARGYRFMTYARHWARAYVIDHVIRSLSMVRLGSGALRSKLFFKLRRERSRLTNLLGDGEARDAALAERLGMAPLRLRHLLDQLDARDVSLDASTEAAPSIAERLPAPDDQERALGEHETLRWLERTVKSALVDLDARERFIVEERWLADDDDALSLAEIGRRLGVSRERARQLEERLKRKLRSRIPRDADAPTVALGA